MNSSPKLAPSQPSSRHKRSKVKWVLLSAAVTLVLAELFCRFVIGLGDPPQYRADAKIEYVLESSRIYRRFHNRIAVNRYGMRAEDFPPKKVSHDELRVLVIGDSIVYGGARIDQTEIATEILKRNLQQDLRRPVVVGNASAKSWGPPNELAYLRKYGTLDSDVIVLELSSHDYADAPKFTPVVGVAAEYPDRKPPLALLDLFETYLLPHYLHWGATPADIDKTLISAGQSKQDIEECRDAERDLFMLARTNHARVALVQHLSLPELNDKYQPGYYANQTVARNESVPYVDDADELQRQVKAGNHPFYEGDPLHLDRAGQQSLAAALRRAVDLALKGN